MIGIIISVILTLITMVALCFNVKTETKKDNWGNEKTEKVGFEFKFKPRALLGMLWLGIILFKTFTMIPANNVGIMYNPFSGGVQTTTLTEGFKSKSPLSKIYTLSTTVEEMTFTNLSVQTADSQWINTNLQIQARIDKTQAFEYFKKYKDSDLEDIASIISNTIKKELESVTIQYNVIDILGEARNEIVIKTLELVKEELLKDGILVERLVIIDTDAGAEIENAIAQEAVAKKNVDTAKYKKEQAELEGQAKIAEAEATAKANALLEKSLTDEVIAKQFIEKWNGQLPTTYAGEDVMGIFNLK